MHMNKALVPVTNRAVSPFNVNKIAKAVLVKALASAYHRKLSVWYNTFWVTKMIALARAYQ